MVFAMASVFRWTVVYWTLAQVVIYCGAVEDPVHIQLHLDGRDSVTDVNNAVKMWYNPQNENTPMYNDPTQRPLVEKAGLKKLYIRGKFEVKDIRYLWWDNGRKDVKALGEFILKIFKPDAVVIVVFPDVHSYAGYQFRKEFEEVVQSKNEEITVGRAVINVYLGLGDQNQKNQVDKLLKAEIEKQTNERPKDHEKDEKYYSIFAEYNSNTFSFRTVFTPWIIYLKPVNIYQVKIQEADSVVVKLMSVCTSDQNVLKVGGHKQQDLADILFKLFHVDDVKTHPKQRIRVELPENCGTSEKRMRFTGELVDNLQMKMKDMEGIRVYGKEPQVHIQFYSGNVANDIEHIKKIHPQDIYININDIIATQVKLQEGKFLSCAKELFIHIHCHGEFSNETKNYEICHKNPKDLADSLINFALKNSEPKTAIIRFNVCEAGTDYGQKYVNTFLTIFDELLQKYQITIQESWSYKYTTSQIYQHTVVNLPPDESCSQHGQTEFRIENEKDIFGSFTVRTIKPTQGYTAFPVLPLTKYELVPNN